MSKERIDSIYPRYSKSLLKIILHDFIDDVDEFLNKTGREWWNVKSIFEIQSKPDFDFSEKNVIASSLFFKDNSIGDCRILSDESGKISSNELNRVHEIFVTRSDRKEKSFMENYVNGMLDWDIGDNEHIIYLSDDLEHLKPIIEDHGRHVFLMNHNGIKHCPGAMWRYLAMNLDCKSVYFADTSEAIKTHFLNRFRAILDEYPDCNLVRNLPITHKTQTKDLVNYPVIPGDQFSIRPSGFPFSADEMMLGYIVLNIMCERSVTNFSFEPINDRVNSSPPSLSEMIERGNFAPFPVDRVAFKCFPHYGFDEMWLKEFAYHQFNDGSMATVMTNLSPGDFIQSLDIDRQNEVGNIMIREDDLVE